MYWTTTRRCERPPSPRDSVRTLEPQLPLNQLTDDVNGSDGATSASATTRRSPPATRAPIGRRGSPANRRSRTSRRATSAKNASTTRRSMATLGEITMLADTDAVFSGMNPPSTVPTDSRSTTQTQDRNRAERCHSKTQTTAANERDNQRKPKRRYPRTGINANPAMKIAVIIDRPITHQKPPIRSWWYSTSACCCWNSWTFEER